jgi:succinate-acetate transporter protein
MSYSAILIPGSGVLAAYSNPQELSNAIGLFLIVWFMFTAMLVCVYLLLYLLFYFSFFHDFWDFFPNRRRSPSVSLPTYTELTGHFSRISPAVIRRNISYSILFVLLAATYLLLGVAELTNKARQVKFNPPSLDHLLIDIFSFLPIYISANSVTKAGGVIGIVTAFVAYYIGVSDILAAEERPIMRLPQGAF